MADPQDHILAVHVAYPNARLVSKVEARIAKYGPIISQLYLRAPDKNGRWVVRSASYTVLAVDPRALKIMLSQLRNADNLLISF